MIQYFVGLHYFQLFSAPKCGAKMVVQYFSTADQLGGLDDGPQMYLSDWQLWNDNMKKRREDDRGLIC